MSKQHVNIDWLEIRLRGISPEIARSAVNGLGQDLLGRLSSGRGLSLSDQPIDISRIDPGTLRVAKGATPDQLRNAIGERIATSIRSKLK